MLRKFIAGTEELQSSIANSEFGFDNEVWIEPIAITPHMRKEGLGKKLIHQGIERAIALHKDIIKLSVKPGNKPAIRLYEGLNFTKYNEGASNYMYYYMKKIAR